MTRQNNGVVVLKDASSRGTFWRLDLGGGRTMVMGPDGYRSYETSALGRTFGEDNRGDRWTSGTFAGRPWTVMRNRNGKA